MISLEELVKSPGTFTINRFIGRRSLLANAAGAAAMLVLESLLAGCASLKPSTSIDSSLSEKEIMQKYFPLAIGNSWTYARTVTPGSDVFFYTEQTVLKPGWNSPPKGAVYFTVGRASAIEKLPQTSEETYSIVRKDEGIFFNVKVEGNSPRDGRYSADFPFSGKKDPNVRWGYVGEGVWEVMAGQYSDAETSNQTWLAVLRPNISVSPPTAKGQPPMWIIGAKMHKGTIAVPAGRFSDCLRNVTMVNGENFADVLFKDAKPSYSKKEGFGCFTVDSFYAKNVGLIKEVQRGASGEVGYTLELKSFKVK